MFRLHACVCAALLAACAHTGKVAAPSPYETARHSQDEVRANLQHAVTAEIAFFQEKDRYSSNTSDIGFWPQPGNRYSYYLAPSGTVTTRVRGEELPPEAEIVPVDRTAHPNDVFPPTVAATQCPITGAPGQSGNVSVAPDRYLILAAGNLDADPAFDCWTVASFDRVSVDGRKIPRHEPHLEQEDVVGTAEEIARYELSEKVRDGATKAVERVCTLVGHKREVPASFSEDLAKASKDPWGRSFAAAYAGERDGDPEYLVVSAGADGTFATSDDAAFTSACDKLRPAEGRAYSVNKQGLVVTIAPVAVPPNGVPAGGVSTVAKTSAGEWVALPGGTFQFGAHESDWNDRNPRRSVQLAPFALEKTEVSVAQFRSCVDAGACTAPESEEERAAYDACNWDADRETDPMNCVSWNQANAFCAWVGGRLPTDYEWEYAAKGGGNRRYPWGNEDLAPRHARYALSQSDRYVEEDEEIESYPEEEYLSRPGTAPVTAYAAGASAQGVLNLVGNVAEWTATKTRYGDVLVRGGNWFDSDYTLSITRSNVGHPGRTDEAGIGFRCAQSR